MDWETYLARIDYQGGIQPNIEVLKSLQRSHLLHIAFENLDIRNNTPIRLDIDNIYQKIVRNHRGGFCYELNGLFFQLLLSLRFNASMISARVHTTDNQYGPEFDHLAIWVKIDEDEYLSDVGFGEFAFHPLKFELNSVQHDERGDFLIDSYDNEYYRVSKMVNGQPVPEYIFTKKRREFRDFEEMCEYHQTNAASHFTKSRIVSLPTKNGRITIAGDTLKIREKDSLVERKLGTEEEFKRELWNFFKMRV